MTVSANWPPEDAFERSLALLDDLCSISSATGDAEGIRGCAERLGRELEDLGFEVRIEMQPNDGGLHQPVLLAFRPPRGTNHILLVGHLDTVLPATPIRRYDDRLEATGALDMKGGFAAFVGALHQLEAEGGAIPEEMVLVAVPDEEAGGRISQSVVRTWQEGARAVLVLEPGRGVVGGETIVTGRRGVTVWRLEARGQLAHSGLAYSEGRSALAAAADWSARVQTLSEPDRGPLVNVGRIVGGDRAFVRNLGHEHRVVGTAERLNVVADYCLVEGETRYLNVADRNQILADLRSQATTAAERWGVELRFETVDEILPAPPSNRGTELSKRLVEAAADEGWTLTLETDRGGVSFPNFLPDPSAMVVIDGLGPVGEGMHTREEFVRLGSLRRRIRLIADLLADLSASLPK